MANLQEIEHVMPKRSLIHGKRPLATIRKHSRPIVAHGRQSHLDRLQCAAVRWSLSRKREILLTSHLELNKYFSAVTDWNEQSIRHRAEVLAETALKVWSYFGSEQPEAALPLQGVRGTTPRSLTILGQTFWGIILGAKLSKSR